MTFSQGGAHDEREASRERTGLVWIDSRGAVIVRWREEPVLEDVPSGVTARHGAVGSVRRGPARPFGGGRVPGHGTEEAHEQELRRFLVEMASRLADLETIEVMGRGRLRDRLAELLRRVADRHGSAVDVSTRTLQRRPSGPQLAARLRRLVDAELPRRLVGRYRLPATQPTTPTGRPLRPAAGRRTLRPPRLPERQEIEEELEQMAELPD
ncbi:MAG TPA: hypothetical protein VFW86_03035 [Candidatus Limnocylindrales bacterium]|nr:hypothetical protein [Candidatus Limnocylindrales bacterium]